VSLCVAATLEVTRLPQSAELCLERCDDVVQMSFFVWLDPLFCALLAFRFAPPVDQGGYPQRDAISKGCLEGRAVKGIEAPIQTQDRKEDRVEAVQEEVARARSGKAEPGTVVSTTSVTRAV
jgi:hypothetical protein